MMRNRSDAYHRKGRKSAAYKLDTKCESLCENALEILQEIVAADASLQKKKIKKFNFLWFIYCSYRGFGNFFIFLKKDILIQKLFPRVINLNLDINSYYKLSKV